MRRTAAERERHERMARFWAKIFAVNFAFGVVTGIPLELQFGTYIANLAGWTTAETGRQPWVVYGLLRTEDGASPAESVPAGTALFTLLGFAGLYVLLATLFVLHGSDREPRP